MTLVATSKYLEFKYAKSPQNHDWYYVRRTNDTNKHDSAVVITTVVKNEDKYQFLLLKTRRPPMYAENKAQYSIESPAGLIGDNDKDENLIECAKKELKEETGLIKSQIYFEHANCSTSNGLSSETLSFTTAIADIKDLTQEPVSDGGIIVERFYIDFEQIDEYIENLDTKKYSIATATISGIYFAQKRINKLKLI